MTSVFICCALVDAPIAAELDRELRERGFDTFVAEGADDGCFAVEQADIVVFLLTHNLLDSGGVRRALAHARSLQKPVAGILVGATLPDVDPDFYWLSALLSINWWQGDRWYGVDSLVRDFESLRSRQPHERVVLRPLDDPQPTDSYQYPAEPGEYEPAPEPPADRDEYDDEYDASELPNDHDERDSASAPPSEPDEGDPGSAPARDPDEYEHASAPPSEPDEDPWHFVLPDLHGDIVIAGEHNVTSPEWPGPASADAMARASEDTVATAADVVDCSVFAPDACVPGRWIFVQAYFHTPKQAADAAALAQEFDPGTTRRGFAGLQLPIPKGRILDVELDIDGVRVSEPVQRLAWRGRAEAVQFDAQIPVDQAEGPLRGAVVVRRDGTPVGRVGFRIMVERASMGTALRRQAEEPIRFSSAFISYASADRDEVLHRVQGIEAVGIAFFQDLLSLDPGARWKPEIYRHIDESDLFLLFWSKAAKKSKWVRREADRALQLQSSNPRQLPEIRPVILGRPVVMPWKELRHLHFNDRLIFLMET